MTLGFIPLRSLLTRGRPPGTPVAIHAGRTVDWATFTADVARLSAIVDGRGPGRWLLYTEDTYAFAVALMAVWQSGGVGVLAPNGQPGTLAELSAGTHGLITEHDRTIARVDVVAALQPSGPMSRSWTVLDRESPRLELFTSGSTGARKAVPKTIANLEDEVAGLDRQWGSLLHGREAFGTVSHQHIYGLLFRVLWPLAAGRMFCGETLLQPEEMAAAMASASACFLVASPAHLSRLKGFAGLARIAAHCRPIFSSGGPVDRATAAALRDAFKASPFEIFGSTETGGVAWRQQDGTADAEMWTPFSRVAVDADPEGLLRVRSPFVSAADGVFTLADRVDTQSDGRFTAGPRGDRTVKVGDKRVSLPEMEAVLAEHALVSQAALLVLDHGTGPRIGAAVVPTPAGRQALPRQGRRAVTQSLTQHLQRYWTGILLPRVWRFVNRLPEDAQGKITEAALQAVFASAFDPAVASAEVVDEAVSDSAVRQTLRVPDTLGCLDGHFAELAVVPGVAQLQWVMEVARALAGPDVALERIEALKFKSILRPGEVVHLRAELSPGRRLHFRIDNERTVFSSGCCVLAAGPADGA